jgi:hypothetical protein
VDFAFAVITSLYGFGPGREEAGGGAGIAGAEGGAGVGVGVFRLFWLMATAPNITKQVVMNSKRLILSAILI